MRQATPQTTQVNEFPFAAVLKSYFADKPVRRAYLFGSYARAEQSGSSDVDVLVELDYEQGADFFSFVQMQEDLSALLQRPVDLVSANGLSSFVRPYIDAEKRLIYEHAHS